MITSREWARVHDTWRTAMIGRPARAVFDLDSTVLTAYGHQQRAEVGYNPMYNVVGVVKRFSRHTGTSASRERSQGRSDGFCRTVYRRPLTLRTARRTQLPTKPRAFCEASS